MGRGVMDSSSKIRKPAVAGKFYDGDAETLQDQIFGMIEKISIDLGDDSSGPAARALILPHAGYSFSGMTAVKTLLRTRGKKYDRVLILAPSHHVPFQGLAASSSDFFRTPLGDVPLDRVAIDSVVSDNSQLIQVFDEAHVPEHSLEVELPLAQEILKDFKLIPFICGYVDTVSAAKIASVLKKLWSADTLWIVSSDFTHFGSYFSYLPFRGNIKQNLKKLDFGAIEKIKAFDPAAFSEYIKSTGATICGTNPIMVLLSLFKELVGEGFRVDSELVEYTSSGEISGDWSHCVSYAGMAFYQQ